jgi:hypothetical protein
LYQQRELTGWIRTKAQHRAEGEMKSTKLHHKAGEVSKKKFVAVISIVLGHNTSRVPGLRISGSYTSNPPHAFMASREKT